MAIEHWVKEYRINPKLYPFIKVIEEHNDSKWVSRIDAEYVAKSRIKKRIDEAKKCTGYPCDTCDFEGTCDRILSEESIKELEGLLKEAELKKEGGV